MAFDEYIKFNKFYFLFNNREFLSTPIKVVTRSIITLLYVFFIIYGHFVLFYAINPTEVIVNISRQLNVLIMYLSMSILIYNIKIISYLFLGL